MLRPDASYRVGCPENETYRPAQRSNKCGHVLCSSRDDLGAEDSHGICNPATPTDANARFAIEPAKRRVTADRPYQPRLQRSNKCGHVLCSSDDDVEDRDEFSHGGSEGDQSGLPVCQTLFRERIDLWVVFFRDDRGHVEYVFGVDTPSFGLLFSNEASSQEQSLQGPRAGSL